MPYVENYLNIIKKENLEYKLVTWDRLRLDEKLSNNIVYEKGKKSVSKDKIEYIRYLNFLWKNIKLKKGDKIILFSLQLLPFLITKRNLDLVIDVRDYHNIIQNKIMKKQIDKADLIVVSSDKFKEFINHENIIINHNYNEGNEILYRENTKRNRITISTIGALRDVQANINLMNIFKNDNEFQLKFHGEGVAASSLKAFAQNNSIKNVTFTGRYEREKEKELYLDADIISMVRDNTTYNNKIALPNRLYKAVKFGLPIITTEGTYLSDIVQEKKIGLSMDGDTETEDFKRRLKDLINKDNYFQRQRFIDSIVDENNLFENNLRSFLRE